MTSQSTTPKKCFTVRLPGALIDRARNAVYWTPGLTLAELTERALDKEVARLERERGKPFTKRPGRLKAGRPIR